MRRLFSVLGLIAGLFIASHAHAANCPTYPFTLTNGTTADANQVMSNFNSILNCTNSNLAHNAANSDITSLSGLTIPLSIAQGGTGASTVASARTALGLGTAALQNIGTSGANVPLLNGTNIWSGNQTILGSSGTVSLALQGPAGTTRVNEYLTNSLLRWILGADGSPESGSNAGTNFNLCRYGDGGSLLDCPFQINRSNGIVSIFDGLSVAGGITGNVSTATALQTARTISLTGAATSTCPAFNGTANISCSTALNNTGVTPGTYAYASVQVGADGRLLGAAAGAAPPPQATVAEFSEQESSGTNSALGAFSAGVWTGEPLNATVGNNISGASVSSSIITLPAGTYTMLGRCVARAGTGQMMVCRIRASTGGIFEGTAVSFAPSTLNTVGLVTATFTIASPTQYALEVWYGSGVSASGGFAMNTGITETYSDVQITKVS